VRKGIIKPVLSETFPYEEIPKAHQLMYENKHSGKMAVLVQVERTGLKNTEEAIKAST
jgi:crotonyl-CoA carboxylase/reductase